MSIMTPYIYTMNRILFTILLAFLTVGVFAQVPPKPTDRAVVYDYANMLTPEDKVSIELMGLKLQSKHASRLVFVSVETKGDMKGIEFIRAIYGGWGIPDGVKGHCGLIVVCKKQIMASIGGGFLVKCDSALTMKIKDSFQELLDKTTLPPFENTEDQNPLKGSTALKDSYMFFANAIIALSKEENDKLPQSNDATEVALAETVAKAVTPSQETQPQTATDSPTMTAATASQPQSFNTLPGTLIPAKPSKRLFVCDYAALLTQEDAAQLASVGQQLEQTTTAELVFVSVPSRGDMPISDFSLKLAKTWGIGKAGKNNGVLLLAVKDNLLAGKPGKIRIEVGYGLEGRLNDSKCGRILDNIALPPFIAKKVSAACSAALRDSYICLAQEIAAESKTELVDVPKIKIPETTGQFLKRIGNLIGWVFCGLFFAGIAVIYFLPDRWFKKGGRFHHSNKNYNPDDYRDDDNDDDDDSDDSDDDDDDYGGGDFGGGGADR